jgi:superfamily I DNA/RNA helicase
MSERIPRERRLLRADQRPRQTDTDGMTGITTLCTYHKAKGREWTRVFLFEHAKRCPSPWAKSSTQVSQELNLSYVATTRAMETLVYVN